MEKIRRNVKLFFVYYGRLLFVSISIIIAVIYFIQVLDNIAKEKNKSKKEQLAIQQQEEYEINYIYEFIDLCNKKEVDKAYNMLSDECKNIKYKSQEEFEEKHIKKIFNINICKYEIVKKEDVYVATLTQDMIITGKTDEYKEVSYKLEGVLQNKIYIISE